MAKRELQVAETKAKIMSAVRTLSKEKGITNIKVRDICQKANVSIGTYYHYFDSIESIFKNAIEEGNKYTENVIIPALIKEDELDNLKLYLLMQMESFQRGTINYLREVFRIYLYSESPFILDENSINYKTILRIIQQGQKKGQMNIRLSSEDYAKIALKLIIANCYCWCMQEGTFDATQVMIHEIISLVKRD